MHTNALMNSTIRLKCRVQLMIQNNTGDLKENYSKMSKHNQFNSQTYSSPLSSNKPKVVWQVIQPYLLPDNLKIIVQWMKDGFGYDQETLKQTFNNRYTMIESTEKDIYDLLITGVQFEDEGEYACQARLIENIQSNQKSPLYFHQFFNKTKFSNQNSINSFIFQHDSFNLPMSLIKSNTAYLNVIVPPKSIHLNILLYENSKFQYLYNHHVNKLNHSSSSSSSIQPIIHTDPFKNQSIWIHFNQTIQFICSTSSWSKPLGHLLWSMNNETLHRVKMEKTLNIVDQLNSSSYQYVNELLLKRTELLSWLNEKFCNSPHSKCHIMNKTQNFMFIEHFSCIGQLNEFIQITDMPTGLQLFKTWSILSLTFYGAKINQIPIMCSLENQNDYIISNSNNDHDNNSNNSFPNINIHQHNRTFDFEKNPQLNEFENYSLRSRIININLLYIDNVYIQIYSNNQLFTSSIEQHIRLIENQPVQVGCFYKKSYAPINNTRYEYTFFIQTNSTPTTLQHNINHSHNNNNSSSSPTVMQSSRFLLLHHHSNDHIIKFVPNRTYHHARIYCQISMRISKPTINSILLPLSSSLRNSTHQIDNEMSHNNSISTDDEDESSSSLRNRTHQIGNEMSHNNSISTDDDVLTISSMGYLDLNIYYGPYINNPENQFHIIYPCSIFGKSMKTFCSTESTDYVYITQDITLLCQTDFNPPGQIEWFTWTPNNNTRVYLSNGHSLQLNLEQLQSSMESITVNSNNAWIIDEQYLNKPKHRADTEDDIMTLENVDFQIKLWKFTCIASLTGFDSQSANRFIVQAEKPFIHSHSQVYGIIGKSIHLICNVISFPPINFTYPIWSLNNEYILSEDSMFNNHVVVPPNSTIKNFQFPIHFPYNFIPKYKFIYKQFTFGWIITLQINNLNLNDEGVYQCSLSNLMGSSSYKINLYLNQYTFTRNGYIVIIIISLILLLSTILLLLFIGLSYIQRKCKYFQRFNQYLCIKCKLMPSSDKNSHCQNETSGYNRKTIGYFTAMDFSEVIQNSLVDTDQNVVVNNTEIDQSFDQPYLANPMLPINQFDHYSISNHIFNEQPSSLQEKCFCKYENNCQQQLNNFNNRSGSNYSSTCPHMKIAILTNNNTDNDKDSYLHDCGDLKQYRLLSATKPECPSVNPNCTVKFLHNKFNYEHVHNDNRTLNFNQPPLLSHRYTNDICLNELMSNSMINNEKTSCLKCDFKNTNTERHYFTLPNHHMLCFKPMRNNIYTHKIEQDQCVDCTLLKTEHSFLTPRFDGNFSNCDNKIFSNSHDIIQLDSTKQICNCNDFFCD
ncbi:unnamed protein product [Schistosoma turkestanicum]|nr:unnamed protein product [Schistosoma turkestanicum]